MIKKLLLVCFRSSPCSERLANGNAQNVHRSLEGEANVV